ncbi:hypothetical protein BDM02DRAFT_3177003 [Thelephora ganbajun]|uniref:Uncharacterized protein n=1 Tax=Thelephora ganbajun TaxID=370292 RepID=A0ACB6YX58_THEGA|nr:hypothetical protein BDM02DRAFT_3177003 [Thelephora ganbajun]
MSSIGNIPISHSLPITMTQGTAPGDPAPPKDQSTERLSAMAKKFLAAKNDPNCARVPYEPEPWKPAHYFFYGSLMDERKLTEVLRLDSPPVLRPASIVGYSIKMWGPYPALVDGPPGNVVSGMIYEVQKEDHEKRLAYYETNAYRCASCFIKPTTGDQIFGKTFVWADDPNDEDLSPGSFDFEAWKKAQSAFE